MSQRNHPESTFIERRRFAENDEEANERYLACKSIDPFPEIPSALLNSADLSDYAAETALIFPYADDDENLKAAAYRVRILGEIVYWEAGGELKSRILKESEQFMLAPNSITYITLEPFFRIPDYIKVWFHLDVSHIDKGLIMNSGFIDPGFVGRLVLPLHNPTANEYPLRARDSLIWITLMKISPRRQWEQPGLFKTVRYGKFREFPEHKKNPKIEERLKEAVGLTGSVRTAAAVMLGNLTESSKPPQAVLQNERAALRQVPVDADNHVAKVNDRWRFGALVAAATLLFTLIGAMGGMLALDIQTNSYTRKLEEDLLTLRAQILQDRVGRPVDPPQTNRADQVDRKPPRKHVTRHGPRRRQSTVPDSTTTTKNK